MSSINSSLLSTTLPTSEWGDFTQYIGPEETQDECSVPFRMTGPMLPDHPQCQVTTCFDPNYLNTKSVKNPAQYPESIVPTEFCDSLADDDPLQTSWLFYCEMEVGANLLGETYYDTIPVISCRQLEFMTERNGEEADKACALDPQSDDCRKLSQLNTDYPTCDVE